MPDAPTVLVTGAGRGIGRACCLRFLEDGWRVVAGVRDVEGARAALPADPALRVVALDVTRSAEVAAAVAAAEAHAAGALSCLVNNAGYAVLGSSEDVDLGEARRMFETNLLGAVAVTQAALPSMRRAGTGAVVNMSSIGARISNPLLGLYHATKYGMTAWSESMRVELAPFGVRVHVVEPGMVETDFPAATRVTGALARGEGPWAEFFTEMRAGFRVWRARASSTAEEVAQAVARAAADASAPFRIPVGADAEEMGAARERLGDEQFHRWLAGYVGFPAPGAGGAAD